ncbi:MAG: hypothetical protein EXS05_02140 [Planctomycetaceae bacterium]|nr:hypothetical protein [Planctomycetaceae bacterium]
MAAKKTAKKSTKAKPAAENRPITGGAEFRLGERGGVAKPAAENRPITGAVANKPLKKSTKAKPAAKKTAKKK